MCEKKPLAGRAISMTDTSYPEHHLTQILYTVPLAVGTDLLGFSDPLNPTTYLIHGRKPTPAHHVISSKILASQTPGKDFRHRKEKVI